MQLPRMTTRRWLVVVALAALAFYGQRAREHWHLCKQMAYEHADEEKYQRFRARPDYPDFVCGMVTPETGPEDEERARAIRTEIRRDEALHRAAYHSELKRKFDQAAWRPWKQIPLEPFDPPES